jgi:two-component system response regulator VicR
MSKILVVEDERSVRQALRFELEDDGHEVMDVNDYAEAYSACNAINYDLIISDIFVSNGNGVQLLNQKMNTPFIAITAFPESNLAVRAKAVLKDRFFEKPFPMNALMNKVHELLNN